MNTQTLSLLERLEEICQNAKCNAETLLQNYITAYGEKHRVHIPDAYRAEIVAADSAIKDLEAAIAAERSAEQKEQATPQQEPDFFDVAKAIHYPDCWDVAAYPRLDDALHELMAWFKCGDELNPCQLAPQPLKPLSITELADLWTEECLKEKREESQPLFERYGRAIEAKLREQLGAQHG